MEAFLARVRRGGVVLGDGAWGTMLINRGLPVGVAPETWTLDRPDVIREIAVAYLDAGAEILTTNTFGGSSVRLRQHGLDAHARAINTRAVELAHEVASGRAWISASVGPTGRLLKPLGDLDADEASAAFAAQIEMLVGSGADLICIETMTDLAESVLAVRAAKAAAPHVPVIATMTFDATPRGPMTIMGVSVERAARGLAEAGADLVGANCGSGVDAMATVARAFAVASSRPVAIRPNAGLPERDGNRLVYRETPRDFAAAAAALLQPGVAVVGGCCGTTPEHIRAMRETGAFGAGSMRAPA
jgi:5-methyltetrahydrofolate--homocysteine methyltransferase